MEKLLSELSDGGYKTAGELADKLNLSEKTVRTRMKELGTICIANGAVLRSKQRYGYCLEIGEPGRFQAFVNGLKEGGEKEKISTPEERVRFLVNHLLNSQSYVKIDQLADELYISRQTMIHDLRKAESIFSEYGIIVEKKSKYGIKAIGQEHVIRRCIADQRIRAGGPHGGSAGPLLDVLKRYGLEISETALRELHTCLEVGMERMKLGFFISLPEDAAFIRDEPEYEAAAALAERLGRDHDVRIPENEVLYFAVLMAGNRTRMGSTWDETNFVIPQYLDELVEKMLDTVYETFALDYRHNLELRMALNYHMVPMDIRLRYQLPLKNPMLEEIRRNYLFAYTVAGQAVIPLMEYYHCSMSEEETGYIALQFALAMERDKKEIQKKRILMVCSSGNGSAQLLKYKYMDEFGKYIEDIGICTVYQLEDMDFSDIDYVLTTVPVSRKIPRPIMEVQTFLNDSEILKIREKLQENELSFLKEYYSPELFFTGLTGNCKEDVIREMCGRIGEYRKLPEDFYESVLKREDLAHTDYGNLVALPHPYKMMTDTTFVGVGVLKKPIYWVNNQVQVVLLVSLAEGKHSRTQEFYKVTTEFLLKEEAVRKLIERPEFGVFMELLRNG